MEIRILHLYYDLMNLYGENGNIRALKKHLCDQGFDVKIDKLSLYDEIDFSNYDVFYSGSGTESNQKYALSHLRKYSDGIRELINAGKIFLFTGNSFEILGQKITVDNLDTYKGLGIFDFNVEEDLKNRITGDVIANFDEIDKPLVGYINKCSRIYEIDKPLFKLNLGPGNEKNCGYEGIRVDNFFGTHITGPILLKNPGFMKYFVNLICSSINSEFQYKPINYIYEEKAYNVTYSELSKYL